MIRRTAALAAVAAALLAAVAPTAAADPSPHCRSTGYCVFSGTGFTGTQAHLTSTASCRQISTLGFPVAHSAARGFGDSTGLQLYPGAGCTGTPVTVTGEVPSTTAVSYRLLPVPR